VGLVYPIYGHIPTLSLVVSTEIPLPGRPLVPGKPCGPGVPYIWTHTYT